MTDMCKFDLEDLMHYDDHFQLYHGHNYAFITLGATITHGSISGLNVFFQQHH